MKRALVMTGGAARGGFMAGVIRGLLEDAELDFDVLAGVSIGALIATNLAQAQRGSCSEESRRWLYERNEALIDAVRSQLPQHRLLSHWPLLGAKRRRVLRAIVESVADFSALRTSGRRLFVGSVDLWTGTWIPRDETNLSGVDELLGMMAMPLLDPPVKIGKELWVDGVLRRTAPVEEVLLEGVDELFIVSSGVAALGSTLRARGIFRALAIAVGELAYDKEIRLAHLAERALGRPRVVLIRPRKGLNARLSLSPSDFEFALEHGREQARLACREGRRGPIFYDKEHQIPEVIRRALTENPPPAEGQ